MEITDQHDLISKTENYPNSNNISATDLDEETNNKLRGDAIGDTLYSQSFVLKTLLRFSDMKWSEEIEEDLCFLWDMTVEKDVCSYLFDLSFPSLACSAIMKCTENRFIEIVIGIIANILCADCDKNITEDEINIILRELNTDDPLILIQLARFISAIAHTSNDLPFISEDVMYKIEFILCNSTNTELLQKTLEVTAKLTTDFKLNKNLINVDMIDSILTAYRLLVTNNSSEEFELDTKEKQLTCRYMLEAVSNVCAYIYQYEDKNNLLQLKNYSNAFTEEAIKIFNYYSHEINLLPITDEFVFYMSVFKFVFEILNVNYMPELFFPLTKILHVILNIKDEVRNLFDIVLELECFMFFYGSAEHVYRDLSCLPKEDVKKLLSAINENKHNFDFKLDIQYFLTKYK